MFNLPIKLSVMSSPYSPLSPQVFLDKTPAACIEIFRDVLPQDAREALDFAYSPTAILQVLEKEFTVHVAQRQLVFLKTALDGESWVLANGLSKLPPVAAIADSLLEAITESLWASTAASHGEDKSLDARIALRREIKTLLLLSFYKYGHQHLSWLQSLQTPAGLQRFLGLVVAEAIYKADGARVLFGQKARYTQLWLAKQAQFYSYLAAITQIHLKQPA